MSLLTCTDYLGDSQCHWKNYYLWHAIGQKETLMIINRKKKKGVQLLVEQVNISHRVKLVNANHSRKVLQISTVLVDRLM